MDVVNSMLLDAPKGFNTYRSKVQFKHNPLSSDGTYKYDSLATNVTNILTILAGTLFKLWFTTLNCNNGARLIILEMKRDVFTKRTLFLSAAVLKKKIIFSNVTNL